MRPLATLSFAFVLALSARAAADPPADEALLERHGCTACHSLDGAPHVGPTLAGLAGRDRPLADGTTARADAAYLRAALLAPRQQVVRGWEDVPMPPYGHLEGPELDRLVAAVQALPSADAPPEKALWPLALSVGLFVLLHFLLSSRPIRGPLARRLGEGGFMGLYALATGAPFAAIFFTWGMAPIVPVYTPPSWGAHLTLTLMAVAFFFLVAGFTTPSPTLAGMERQVEKAPRGILTVTRHPGLWGFALWAMAHLIANGDLRTLILAGGILVLALGGMVHIDARRKRKLGADWERFARQTSRTPFLAVVRGRTRLDTTGWGWRLLVALALTALVALFLHRWLIGVPALPPGWAPAW